MQKNVRIRKCGAAAKFFSCSFPASIHLSNFFKISTILVGAVSFPTDLTSFVIFLSPNVLTCPDNFVNDRENYETCQHRERKSSPSQDNFKDLKMEGRVFCSSDYVLNRLLRWLKIFLIVSKRASLVQRFVFLLTTICSFSWVGGGRATSNQMTLDQNPFGQLIIRKLFSSL